MQRLVMVTLIYLVGPTIGMLFLAGAVFLGMLLGEYVALGRW